MIEKVQNGRQGMDSVDARSPLRRVVDEAATGGFQADRPHEQRSDLSARVKKRLHGPETSIQVIDSVEMTSVPCAGFALSNRRQMSLT
jgi:hypothetical protein